MPRTTPRENPWPRALGVSLAVHLLLLLVPLTTAIAHEEDEALVELVAFESADLVEDGVADRGEEAAPLDPDLSEGIPEPDEADAAQATLVEEEAAPLVVEEEDDVPTRHVMFDEDVRESDVETKTDRIASKNVAVRKEARALTPILERGPTAPAQLGASGQAGQANPQRSRDLASESGDERRAADDRRAKAPRAPVVTSDGRDEAAGAATAAGATSIAERDGGQEGEDLAGRGARPESKPSAGIESAEIVGQLESPALAPDGWEPFAVRIEPSLGQPAPSMEESSVETERRVEDDMVVQAKAPKKPRETGDAGETEVRSPTPSELEEPSPAVADADDDGEDSEDLERAWGGEQVVERNDEAGSTGTMALNGQAATTPPLVVERTLAEGATTEVAARLHPHAEYMDQLDDGIHQRWRELTPLEVRAMGLQGTVVVTLEIDARGRVVTKSLVKKSGYSELDELALSSIPNKVKRPPAGAAEPMFVYEMEFRHTDRWASAN